tara:strand:+ start:2486 stop:3250 length:765 start_codon:yes stop_codon:yes gene_type:complete
MSTLRVDNIKSRTGSVVTIPEGQTLAVTGIGSIIGDTNVTGNLNVTGAFSLTGASQFNTNSGIATFGKIRVGNGTTEAVDVHIENSVRVERIIGIGSEVSIDGPNKRLHGVDEAYIDKIFLGSVGLGLSTGSGGEFLVIDDAGVKRGLEAPDAIVMTEALTVLSNRTYYVDTGASTGVVTAFLPATPRVNDFVTLIDYQGYWDNNPLIVRGNTDATVGASTYINGSLDFLECDVEHASITLTFTGITTTGWIVN